MNLAGLDFSPGYDVYERNYWSPTVEELDYFKSKGMTVFRLPFRWERVQHTLYGELDPFDLGLLDYIVNAAADRGLKILIDPHNFGRYIDPSTGIESTIGSPEVPISAFADFWARLAAHYAGHPGVYGYGLMNEPHSLASGGVPGRVIWPEACQAAIDAIRGVDARTLILVPGYEWSTAIRWPIVSDGLKDLVDPSNNLIYEAHSYLVSAGRYDLEDCSALPVENGADRLEPFISWLRANGKKGMIGECGAPADPCWLNMFAVQLDYACQSADVLVSYQYWAAGPRWGDNPSSIEPTIDTEGNYVDKPQMTVLSQYMN